MFRTLSSVCKLGCTVSDGSLRGLPLGWQWVRHTAGASTSPLLRELDVHMPKSVKELVPPLEPRTPDAHSLRTGLLAVKVGMVSEWDEYGKLTPYTVLWFDENQACSHSLAQQRTCWRSLTSMNLV